MRCSPGWFSTQQQSLIRCDDFRKSLLLPDNKPFSLKEVEPKRQKLWAELPLRANRARPSILAYIFHRLPWAWPGFPSGESEQPHRQPSTLASFSTTNNYSNHDSDVFRYNFIFFHKFSKKKHFNFWNEC